MASTEEELPEELDKLQISPSVAQTTGLIEDRSAVQNPFFETGLNVSPINLDSAGSPITTRMPICRRGPYRVRRASESVVDELKNTASGKFEVTDYLRTPPGGGVLKQSLKKTASSATSSRQRKLILREPILKALHTCLQPQGSVRRSLQGPGLPGQGLDSSANNSDSPLTGRGFSDFRDLVQECHHLLTEDVEFNGRLNHLSVAGRNSKNFTTMQTQQTPQSSGSRSRSKKTYQKHQQILNRASNSCSVPESLASCASEDHSDCLHALAPALLTTSRTLFSASSSPEHASTSARCSTTCSQQAGSTVATSASDDVTIDELASYFDTFVHIPKKMSSMAEMMYI